MAATLLDTQVASGAPSTSITVTMSVTPVAGNRLIAMVGHSDDFPAVPSGWTQDAQSVQSGVVRIFSKIATGSEGTSFTFTAPSGGGFTARVLLYSGLGNLHSVAGSASSGTNQILFGSTTTTVADTLLLAAGLLHGTSIPTTDMTWSNSFAPVGIDTKTSGTGKQTQLGVAGYTASATSTFTTVASYVPTASTGVEGALVSYEIPVQAGQPQGTLATITSSTGWTPTGGTMQAVLADSNDSTIATSADNPSNALIDGTLSSLQPPTGDFTVRLRARKINATTGSITGKLYEGATLRATATVSLANTLGVADLVFTANQLTAIAASSWTSGLRLTIEATAA